MDSQTVELTKNLDHEKADLENEALETTSAPHKSSEDVVVPMAQGEDGDVNKAMKTNFAPHKHSENVGVTMFQDDEKADVEKEELEINSEPQKVVKTDEKNEPPNTKSAPQKDGEDVEMPTVPDNVDIENESLKTTIVPQKYFENIGAPKVQYDEKADVENEVVKTKSTPHKTRPLNYDDAAAEPVARHLRWRYWSSWEEHKLVELWYKYVDEITTFHKPLPVFRKIAELMQQTGCSLNPQECRRRMNSYKNRYFLERKRIGEDASYEASGWNLYPLVECLFHPRYNDIPKNTTHEQQILHQLYTQVFPDGDVKDDIIYPVLRKVPRGRRPQQRPAPEVTPTAQRPKFTAQEPKRPNEIAKLPSQAVKRPSQVPKDLCIVAKIPKHPPQDPKCPHPAFPSAPERPEVSKPELATATEQPPVPERKKRLGRPPTKIRPPPTEGKKRLGRPPLPKPVPAPLLPPMPTHPSLSFHFPSALLPSAVAAYPAPPLPPPPPSSPSVSSSTEVRPKRSYVRHKPLAKRFRLKNIFNERRLAQLREDNLHLERQLELCHKQYELEESEMKLLEGFLVRMLQVHQKVLDRLDSQERVKMEADD